MHDRFRGKTIETLDTIDCNRNMRSPNLGGYTQWVRWRAPNGKKLHQVQSSSSTQTRKKTLRMTLRVTRRLGGYCRRNNPPVGSSRRNNLRKHWASIAPSAQLGIYRVRPQIGGCRLLPR